jgi:outer membrane lipoprotein-sorting protein
MKKILISLLLAILCSSFYGQDKATAILEEVKAKTESYKTIKAGFTYKMENKQAGINESKDGTILIKGDKYRLTIAGQLVICNGKTVWTYLKESEEVQINNVDASDESITLSNLLDSYQEDYKSKFISEKAQGAKTVQTIELTPLKGKTYSKIRIDIEKTKKQILSFVLYDKNGSSYSTLIREFVTDTPMNDAEFTFDVKKYPGVEVVDMR